MLKYSTANKIDDRDCGYVLLLFFCFKFAQLRKMYKGYNICNLNFSFNNIKKMVSY